MNLSDNLSISRYEWAEIILKSYLPKLKSNVVLDIGAGDGKMKHVVQDLGGKWQGFDIQPNSSEIRFWNLENQAPDSSLTVDIILMLDVLEHLRNPWICIKNISEIIKQDGIVVITMPNPRWSRSRLFALKSGYPSCFTQSDLDLNHHVFTTWPHIIERLFCDMGFNIDLYVTLDGTTNMPGKPYNMRYPVRFAVALVNKLIEKLDPTACGMSYGIIARKVG